MSYDVHISVIVDNTALSPDLITEHGLSLWIEYKGKKILFDTGQSNAVISNAKKTGIDLASTDAVVLSHGHYDHTGGLSDTLDIAKKAEIYLHPLAIEPKFSQKASDVKYIGMPDSAKKVIESRHVIWTATPVTLFSGMVITGQVPRVNNYEDVGGDFFLDENCQEPDGLLDDQTLFIESSKGLIVVFGCAHSGVVNILDYISKLTGCKKVYAVIGGMHLLNASQRRIKNTVETFKKYEVQKLIPLHCTGQKVMEHFKSFFGYKYSFSGAGDKITF
ncbi:MAG: MBL fold metallo-hydrolase [Sedimentisphaerales bacterium]|nr:MBL fold metallo-hydrolase [Sedimentisphaerales bacterium]